MNKVLLFFLLLFMASCGPKEIYNEEKIISNSSWSKTTPITFEVNVEDTTKAYNMLLDVNINERFKFQNVYTKVITTYPDKKQSEDVVSLELNKSNGISLGSCSFGKCEIPILFHEKIYFPLPGQYKISLDQYGRTDTIFDINSFRLKVVEEKE